MISLFSFQHIHSLMWVCDARTREHLVFSTYPFSYKSEWMYYCFTPRIASIFVSFFFFLFSFFRLSSLSIWALHVYRALKFWIPQTNHGFNLTLIRMAPISHGNLWLHWKSRSISNPLEWLNLISKNSKKLSKIIQVKNKILFKILLVKF